MALSTPRTTGWFLRIEGRDHERIDDVGETDFFLMTKKAVAGFWRGRPGPAQGAMTRPDVQASTRDGRLGS